MHDIRMKITWRTKLISFLFGYILRKKPTSTSLSVTNDGFIFYTFHTVDFEALLFVHLSKKDLEGFKATAEQILDRLETWK